MPVAAALAEILQWADEPYFDVVRDLRVLEGENGTLVAWGRVWHQPSGEREERAYVFGGVDPAHRGRGIGRALLAWQVERAAGILRAASSSLPLFVRAHSYTTQADQIRLHARFGLEPARYNDELVRDLVDLPPRPDVPGIAIVPWDEARSEEARVAQNDAFADHWGSTPRDPQSWAHDVTSYGTRLDLSFLALDGDRVVAVCRNGHFPDDELATGRRDGWVINVSVVRSHRKRGIASALLVASLEAFRSAGLTHSALGVDSENPTGAYGLYQRLGWEPKHRMVVCQKRID